MLQAIIYKISLTLCVCVIGLLGGAHQEPAYFCFWTLNSNRELPSSSVWNRRSPSRKEFLEVLEPSRTKLRQTLVSTRWFVAIYDLKIPAIGNCNLLGYWGWLIECFRGRHRGGRNCTSCLRFSGPFDAARWAFCTLRLWSWPSTGVPRGPSRKSGICKRGRQKGVSLIYSDLFWKHC